MESNFIELPELLVEKCIVDGRSICENGGECSVDEEGNTRCTCPNEFEGNHCEISKPRIPQYYK